MVSSPPHTGLRPFCDSVAAPWREALQPTPVATVRIDQLAVYRVPQAYPGPPNLTPAAKNRQKSEKIAKKRKKVSRGTNVGFPTAPVRACLIYTGHTGIVALLRGGACRGLLGKTIVFLKIVILWRQKFE